MTHEIRETSKKVDDEILRLLSEDNRLSHRELGRKLNRSPLTIKNHVERLEKKGVIKSHGVQLDFEKLGYEIIAIIEITIDKGEMIEVERNIAQDPHIFAVYDITGEYDALFIARFKNRSELNALIKKIHTFQYVQRTNTHLVLNVIKENDSFKKLIELDKQKE
ncbi:MAG: Lrp/AsnC family transcriptional regulator [Promethearchaeota archaeon]|jgi:DNA-binding Lrp family transcriptional regulator